MVWIANNAAFRASKWNVYGCALPGHPRSQRLDFIERYPGMIADAALTRAPRRVVLHTEAFKHPNASIIHLYRQRKRKRPPRAAKHLTHSWIKIAFFSRRIELTHCNAERVKV